METLSLEDLERFDPMARAAGGSEERRFCCPLPPCGEKRGMPRTAV
jgi:hypothetical protein